MIWYQHWLELRYRVLAASILPLLFGVYFATLLYSPQMRDQNAESLAREWPRFAGSLASMNPEHFIVWTAHVISSGFASLIATLATTARVPNNIYYTLSLPASRLRWVWTRFAAQLSIVAAINLALFLIHSLLVLATGHTAPWGAMALASICGILSSLPFLAAFQPLLARTLAMPLGLLSMVWAPSHTDQAAAGQPILWAYVAVGLVGFALTFWTVPRRDF